MPLLVVVFFSHPFQLCADLESFLTLASLDVKMCGNCRLLPFAGFPLFFLRNLLDFLLFKHNSQINHQIAGHPFNRGSLVPTESAYFPNFKVLVTAICQFGFSIHAAPCNTTSMPRDHSHGAWLRIDFQDFVVLLSRRFDFPWDPRVECRKGTKAWARILHFFCLRKQDWF